MDPWGDWRADLRAGQIASVMANCHRAKNTKAYKPQDFMPFHHEPKRSLSERIRTGFRRLKDG